MSCHPCTMRKELGDPTVLPIRSHSQQTWGLGFPKLRGINQGWTLLHANRALRAKAPEFPGTTKGGEVHNLFLFHPVVAACLQLCQPLVSLPWSTGDSDADTLATDCL